MSARRARIDRPRIKGIVCLLVLSIVPVTGCDGLRSDSSLPGPQVRLALQEKLGVALTEAPAVIDTATLANVEYAYAARTSNERLLVVVFESPAATHQILGESARDADVSVVRRSNVVALYAHTRGTVSRLADVRGAIYAVPTG